MRKYFAGLIMSAMALCEVARADYDPYYDNALADVRLRIVDDRGNPVEGATVTAVYGLIFEKSEYSPKLSMRIAFNPEPNDTNLEYEGGCR